MSHFLLHWLGLDSANGRQYLSWSGFVGDLGMFTGGLLVLRHFNCHRKGCWRLGHKVGNGHVRSCHKHNIRHPGRKRNLSAEDHRRAQRHA